MPFKPRKNRRKPDWVSVEAAKIHHVTPRYVNMVRDGERNDENIMITVMDLIEGHNKLVEHVTKIAPLDKKNTPTKTLKLGDLNK